MDSCLVKVRELPHHQGLSLPAYQTDGAAGMDIAAAVSHPLLLSPGCRVLVPSGLILAIPSGFEAQIRPRSGLAIKNGITVLNSPGTIDADYRGELQIILINLGQEDFLIERGMRIAQMVIAPIGHAQLTLAIDLADTERGAGGFGHSGL